MRASVWRLRLIVAVAAVLYATGGVVGADKGKKRPFGGDVMPIGGPKEIVPKKVQNRNLNNTILFFERSLESGAKKVLQQVLTDQTPTAPVVGDIPEWADDIQGQITPLGQYSNFQKSSEYFHVLPVLWVTRASIVDKKNIWISLLTGHSALFVLGKYVVTEAFASGNMVHVDFQIHVGYRTFYPNSTTSVAGPSPGKPTYNLHGVLYFNRDSKICGFDLAVRGGDAFYNALKPIFQEPGFPELSALALVPDGYFKDNYLPSDAATTLLEEICDVATSQLCTDIDESYYKDREECLTILGQKRPGTSVKDLSGDTIMCRVMHRLLVPTAPELHCKHLAPDLSEEQGGVCIDGRGSYAQVSRKFQCGYNDVGYVGPATWATDEYPTNDGDMEKSTPFLEQDVNKARVGRNM